MINSHLLQAVMEAEAQKFARRRQYRIQFFFLWPIGAAPSSAAKVLCPWDFIAEGTPIRLPLLLEPVATDPAGTVAVAQRVRVLVLVPDKVLRFVHHVPQPLLRALYLLRAGVSKVHLSLK